MINIIKTHILAISVLAISSVAGATEVIDIKEGSDHRLTISVCSKKDVVGDGIWVEWFAKSAGASDWTRHVEKMTVGQNRCYVHNINSFPAETEIQYGIYNWIEKTAQKEWFTGSGWMKFKVRQRKSQAVKPTEIVDIRKTSSLHIVSITIVDLYTPMGDGVYIEWFQRPITQNDSAPWSSGTTQTVPPSSDGIYFTEVQLPVNTELSYGIYAWNRATGEKTWLEKSWKYLKTGAQNKNEAASENYSRALGLVNLGQTCFANSVHKLFMALAHRPRNPSAIVTPLQKSFFAMIEKLKRNDTALPNDPTAAFTSDDRFRPELNQFYDNLDAALWAEGGSPNISLHYDSQIRSDQVDAQDYFLKLVDLLALGDIYHGFRISHQLSFPSTGDRNKLFTEPGDNFSVALNIHDESVKNLNDALRTYFTPFALTGADKGRNDRTGLLQDAEKREYLTLTPSGVPPQNIVLTLERFVQEGTQRAKLTKRVELNKLITIDFHASDLKRKVSKRYRLKAVVIHHGVGFNSGHFTAYTLDARQNWIRHDDSDVRPVPADQRAAAEEEMNTNGYMMLFEEV